MIWNKIWYNGRESKVGKERVMEDVVLLSVGESLFVGWCLSCIYGNEGISFVVFCGRIILGGGNSIFKGFEVVGWLV